ncbi:hypothetical protein [Paraburkholderia sp. RL17-373-BIF-A]
MLELLIRAEGQTVTKDEILRHVWPSRWRRKTTSTCSCRGSGRFLVPTAR